MRESTVKNRPSTTELVFRVGKKEVRRLAVFGLSAGQTFSVNATARQEVHLKTDITLSVAGPHLWYEPMKNPTYGALVYPRHMRQVYIPGVGAFVEILHVDCEIPEGTLLLVLPRAIRGTPRVFQYERPQMSVEEWLGLIPRLKLAIAPASYILLREWMSEVPERPKEPIAGFIWDQERGWTAHSDFTRSNVLQGGHWPTHLLLELGGAPAKDPHLVHPLFGPVSAEAIEFPPHYGVAGRWHQMLPPAIPHLDRRLPMPYPARIALANAIHLYWVGRNCPPNVDYSGNPVWVRRTLSVTMADHLIQDGVSRTGRLPMYISAQEVREPTWVPLYHTVVPTAVCLHSARTLGDDDTHHPAIRIDGFGNVAMDHPRIPARRTFMWAGDLAAYLAWSAHPASGPQFQIRCEDPIQGTWRSTAVGGAGHSMIAGGIASYKTCTDLYEDRGGSDTGKTLPNEWDY